MKDALRWMWVAVAAAGLTGCRVDRHGRDGSENVRFASPLGGMSVKTDSSVSQGGLGLSVYPGATLLHKTDGDGDGAADVNMSFGDFHLGVKVLSYHTDDAPGPVQAFYRKDMAHLGTVILCRDSQPVGLPDHTPDGLNCGTSRGTVHVDEHGSDELKAGSRQHQHIVVMDPRGSGTKISLVALDLPVGLGADEDKQ